MIRISNKDLAVRLPRCLGWDSFIRYARVLFPMRQRTNFQRWDVSVLPPLRVAAALSAGL
jgi:hypothetical protein